MSDPDPCPHFFQSDPDPHFFLSRIRIRGKKCRILIPASIWIWPKSGIEYLDETRLGLAIVGLQTGLVVGRVVGASVRHGQAHAALLQRGVRVLTSPGATIRLAIKKLRVNSLLENANMTRNLNVYPGESD